MIRGLCHFLLLGILISFSSFGNAAGQGQPPVDAKSATISANAGIGGINGMLKTARDYRSQGKYQDAASVMQQAVTLRPNIALLWLELSIDLHGAKRYAECETAADKSIGLSPKGSIAYYFKADSSLKLGMKVDPVSFKMTVPQSAIDAYQKYLSLDPNGQYANDVREILVGIGVKPITVLDTSSVDSSSDSLVSEANLESTTTGSLQFTGSPPAPTAQLKAQFVPGLPQCTRTQYTSTDASLYIVNSCSVAVTVGFTSDSGKTWGQGDVGPNAKTEATAFGVGYNPKRDGTVYLFTCPKGTQPVMPMATHSSPATTRASTHVIAEDPSRSPGAPSMTSLPWVGIRAPREPFFSCQLTY